MMTTENELVKQIVRRDLCKIGFLEGIEYNLEQISKNEIKVIFSESDELKSKIARFIMFAEDYEVSFNWTISISRNVRHYDLLELLVRYN